MPTLTIQYTKDYEALNLQQRQAVDAIEGPVMVVAGPGTGKTQILACRIGNILLQTDAQPHNILCLTYTDAGVVAMRKRLLKTIGPDAYKITINTYHAFCNNVIQNNLSEFEKTTLEQVSDLETINLLKTLIDSFTDDNPLKRYKGNIYYESKPLKNLFELLSQEAWDVESIKNVAKNYIADLPNNKDFIYQINRKPNKIGDLKLHLIQPEITKVNKLLAALDQFVVYKQLMIANNRYDYADMINWVLTAFETNQNFSLQYQEQYQYVLVDEFQDTNGTQNKLIELLTNYWESPNLFVVGDDDQSIFRFQGANVANMKHFAQKHAATLQTIVLTQNYRSTQPILNTAMQLIAYNYDRLVNTDSNLSKNLEAAKPELQQINIPTKIVSYTNQHHEMIGTALAIQNLINSGEVPSKIAVIYKENKYGEELATYLRVLNIAYTSKRQLNLLAEPLIVQLIEVLSYINAELNSPFTGDSQLFQLLHYNWFGIPAYHIAKAQIDCTWHNKQNKDAPKISLREWLVLQANEELTALHPKLIYAIQALEACIASVPNDTLQVWVHELFTKLLIVPTVTQQPNKQWLLKALTSFFNYIKEESKKQPNYKLNTLLQQVTIMQEQNIKLNLYQAIGVDKGVQLLTCHGSKGLEFKNVFIVGAVSPLWEGKGAYPVSYSVTNFVPEYTNVAEINGVTINLNMEEQRRLFYVAITRAEQALTVSYFNYTADNKEITPSVFIAEINEGILPNNNTIYLTDEQVEAFAILELSEAPPVNIKALEEAYVTPIVESFVLSVTAINKYLNCPLDFYYNNILRVPGMRTPASEFGTVIHKCFEVFYKKMLASGNSSEQRNFPTLNTLLADFNYYLGLSSHIFTPQDYTLKETYGTKILTNYYEKYKDTLTKNVVIEKGLQAVIGGVPITGKLDKIEIDGSNINVVDYKTGNFKKALSGKFKLPNVTAPNGGDYWRQAVFYKILVDASPDNIWEATSAEFDFVEPNENNQYHQQKVVVSPDDIKAVKQQIDFVWEKINAYEFYTGCGKKECIWCNFTNTSGIAINPSNDDSDE